MSSVLVSLLYLFLIPYILLMLLVVAGMFKRTPVGRSRATPSVSVVLPAHNEEQKLPSTLASLAAQRYEGQVEFVIVDDRSTDSTRAIVERFVAHDPRFKLVSVDQPSRKLAPKVNAVNHGIMRSKGEIIVATDADCLYHPEWVAGMVSHFEDDVAMVVGYVSTSLKGQAKTLLQRFESVDWFTLMLVSRSLTRFGFKFASSANNMAYRREAFDRVGGFGAAGRAPSGDEDLLTQRIGRLPGARMVFAEDERVRVLTRGVPSTRVLLRQRRRWVSRYHHVLHYHPGFMAGITALGLQSVFLVLCLLLLPLLPQMWPWVLGIWAVKAAVEWTGMGVMTKQWDRPDLWGLSTLWWILWHPAFIAVAVVGSFLSPAAWHAGAESYRRRFFQRRFRELKRKLKAATLKG